MIDHERNLLRPAALGSTLACCLLSALAHAADGPSFDCKRATSQVNRMICASPELSALDRQLATHFQKMQGQGGIDGAALAREETAWLRDVRNACTDAACVSRAYQARDADLLAHSLHAASPAAAAQTEPFAVDAALWVAARSLRGRSCERGERSLRADGYVSIPGALPLIFNGSAVIARRRLGADFAFLIDTRGDGWKVADVVALPPRSEVGNLLQCHVPAQGGSATPASSGVGVRRVGQKALLAYWEVNLAAGQLIRQPLGVLAWEQAMRCQQPATGE